MSALPPKADMFSVEKFSSPEPAILTKPWAAPSQAEPSRRSGDEAIYFMVGNPSPFARYFSAPSNAPAFAGSGCLPYIERGGTGEGMTKQVGAVIEIRSDGTGLFVIFDGVKIAKRGPPGTPQAGTWVSLEPGWTVLPP